MFSNQEPFLNPDSSLDNMEAVEAQVAFAGHPHLIELSNLHQRLLGVHAMFHTFGHHSSKEHDEVIRHLDQVEAWTFRGLRGIWN